MSIYKILPTNDGSNNDPELRLYISSGGIRVPNGPDGSDDDIYQAIKTAGYRGVQDGDEALCQKYGLEYSAGARVNEVGDVAGLIQEKKDLGHQCLTLHVAWGIEDDAEVFALVDDILTQSTIQNFPVYIETHRATITDDMWRTVQLVKKFPEIRFNGDFSHWYTGHEMVYGGMDMKIDFLKPVIDRVRYMHGRIANPGNIQVDVGDGKGGEEYVSHFEKLWAKSFQGFKAEAKSGDFMIFCPELLPSEIFYARTFPNAEGQLVEEGNRWEQALVLCEIAQRAWDQPNQN